MSTTFDAQIDVRLRDLLRRHLFPLLIIAFLIGASVMAVRAQSPFKVSAGLGFDSLGKNQPTFLFNGSYKLPITSDKHKIALHTDNVFGAQLVDSRFYASYKLPSLLGKYTLSPQLGAACVNRNGVARCHPLFGLNAYRDKTNAYFQWYAPTGLRKQFSEWRIGGSREIAQGEKIAVSFYAELQALQVATAATGREAHTNTARLGFLVSNRGKP